MKDGWRSRRRIGILALLWLALVAVTAAWAFWAFIFAAIVTVFWGSGLSRGDVEYMVLLYVVDPVALALSFRALIRRRLDTVAIAVIAVAVLWQGLFANLP